MPEIAPKEKRAKSSLTAFQAFFGKPCCRQTKYNSTGPKTRSKCEGQVKRRKSCAFDPTAPSRRSATAGARLRVGALPPRSSASRLAETGMDNLLVSALHSAATDSIAQPQILVIAHAPGILTVVADERLQTLAQ